MERNKIVLFYYVSLITFKSAHCTGRILMYKSLELSLYAISLILLCFCKSVESQIQVDGPLRFGLSTGEEGKKSPATNHANDEFINITTGLPHYTVPLYRLYSKNRDFCYDVKLNYSGSNIQSQKNIPNEFADVSSAGFGWDCRTSYIFVEHKNTRRPDDDSYYFVFSDGTISEMQKHSNTIFTLKADARWTINAESPDKFDPHCPYTIDDCYQKEMDEYGYKTFTIKREDGCYYLYSRQMYYIAPYRHWEIEIEPENPFQYFGLDDHGVNAKFYYLFTLTSISGPALKIEKAKRLFYFGYDNAMYDGEYAGHYQDTRVGYKFSYPISYQLNWIDNNTPDGIAFDIEPKGNNEGALFNVDYRVTHPFPFHNYQKMYINSVYYGGVYNYKTQQIEKPRDRIIFSYTNQDGESNSLNNGIKGKEKRLLTRLKRMTCPEAGFSQGGENQPLCILQHDFEYDFENYQGMLKAINMPDVGRTVHFDYTTKSVGGKNFWVVDNVRQSGGIATISDLNTSYSYSINVDEYLLKNIDQQYTRYYVEYVDEIGDWVILPDYQSPALNYDRSMVYWGNVTRSGAAGSTIFEVEINEQRNLGAIKNKTDKNISGQTVTSQNYQYILGDEYRDLWYLSSVESKIDNVLKISGTSPKNTYDWFNWNRYMYEKNSNSTKVISRSDPVTVANSRRKFSYGFSEETVYDVNNYSTNMDLSNDDVVQAKYIVWDYFESGSNQQFKPFETYVWNPDLAGGEIADFQPFDVRYPIENAKNNWVLVHSNTNCTEWGSVCEEKFFRSRSNTSDFLCNSKFYRSGYGIVVADVRNAELKECAFLSGDNTYNSTGSDFEAYYLRNNTTGPLIDSYLWQRGFWESQRPSRLSNICEVQSNVKHFSENCIHVYKSYGPTTKISKVDPNVGHVFCAWILPVDFPMRLTVEVIKKSDNSKVCTFDDLAKDLTLGKWQKVKKNISANDLKMCGIENGDLYYFKIWIGNYPTDANQSDFYVDDIRFYPKDALVKTFFYEMENGYIKPTVTIDENENPGHVVFYDEIGRPREWNKIILNGNVTDNLEIIKSHSYKTQGLTIKRRDLVGTAAPVTGIVRDLKTLWVYGTWPIEWFIKDATVNIKIEYTLDGGSVWNLLASSTENDGIYWWHLPGNLEPSDRCKIRITDVSNSAVTIESSNEFSIKKGRRFIRLY